MTADGVMNRATLAKLSGIRDSAQRSRDSALAFSLQAQDMAHAAARSAEFAAKRADVALFGPRDLDSPPRKNVNVQITAESIRQDILQQIIDANIDLQEPEDLNQLRLIVERLVSRYISTIEVNPTSLQQTLEDINSAIYSLRDATKGLTPTEAVLESFATQIGNAIVESTRAIVARDSKDGENTSGDGLGSDNVNSILDRFLANVGPLVRAEAKDRPVATTAIASLLLGGIYFFIRLMATSKQAYYRHLSGVWYDRKAETLEDPEFADPEITSMYGIGWENSGRAQPSKYDNHAWACWALVEDWYFTWGRWRDFNARWIRAKPRLTGKPWWQRSFLMAWTLGWFVVAQITRVVRAAWSVLPQGILGQFEGTARNVYELHWAWLRVPEHKVRFDANFLDWVGRYFDASEFGVSITEDPAKIKASRKRITRSRRIAWRRLVKDEKPNDFVAANTDILAGMFLGHFDGKLSRQAGEHTIQVGPSMHVTADTVMKFLNHSNQPNAVVRGLSVFALKDIRKGEEVYIDYNASEWKTTNDCAGHAPGYAALLKDEAKRQEMWHRTHRWIRTTLYPGIPSKNGLTTLPDGFSITVPSDIT